MNKKFETETLYNGIQARYENTKTLFHEKNTLQDLILFENPILGRILMLDGVTQVTEADEFVYHEMMTHTPIFAHDNPKNILIIGGGDGGIAREVLRHQRVETVTMIEIDKAVVDFSQKFMPKINDGVFDSPKLKLEIADGAAFVKHTSEKFDIIIVDSTDPEGPGEVLFTHEFYTDCHAILNPDGILVTQNGVPFMQPDELKQSVTFFRDIFKNGSCFRATIPTYAFGEMTMGWATDKNYNDLSLVTLQKRFDTENLTMRYYTPKVHLASFALPAYIENIIKI
ncbi:MAG: spermidine synthase [Alphaproteobacteria bacterium]|jgi:spermidine synthase